MTFWKKEDHRDRKQIRACGRLGEEEWTRKEPRRRFSVHIWTGMVVTELYASAKTHFTVCQSPDPKGRQKPDPCPPPHLHPHPHPRHQLFSQKSPRLSHHGASAPAGASAWTSLPTSRHYRFPSCLKPPHKCHLLREAFQDPSKPTVSTVFFHGTCHRLICDANYFTY